MKRPEFYPVRSLIYVDLAKEDYRIKLEYWLYRYHIQDSIAQFGPYVSKYAFYQALPVPEGGERFGAVRMQLTEHYWLANPNDIHNAPHKTLTEYFPPEVLVWQNNLPESAINPDVNLEGDDARATKGDADAGTVPFIFAFVPVWWEDDLKGEGRTSQDGPNYRWQLMFAYPEGVSKEEGDRWVKEEFLPAFVEDDRVNRVLTNEIMSEVNDCPFQRVCEIWFDGPTAWQETIASVSEKIKKPEWAETDDFPYFKKSYGISSIFLSDIARSDNYTQYRGYYPMR
jgi:hypothetical protein